MKQSLIESNLEGQSRTITALRFPLSFLVILIHVPLAESAFVPAEVSKLTTYHGLSHYLILLISFVWSNAVVPSFFLFSGYYMFFKERNWLNPSVYLGEMQKKIKSLFLPYLFWSLLPLLLSLLRSAILSSTPPQIFDLSLFEIITNVWWKNIYNFPLWYLKELIIFSLLAPIFYLIIKKCPILIIGLFTIYIFNINEVISSRGLFYFSLGAFLGDRKIDMISYLKPYKRWIISTTLLGSLILPFYINLPHYSSLLYLHTFFVVMCFLLWGGQ